MKIKTNELTGAALDWAVAKAEGLSLPPFFPENECWINVHPSGHDVFAPSTDWSQAGPIIEREDICLDQREGEPCRAFTGTPVHHAFAMFASHGQPLVAAMRCFVASKLGDEVEVPEELVK